MKGPLPYPDFAQMWAERVEGSNSHRMKDDQAEREFWRRFISKKTYAPDRSSRQVLERLLPLFRACGVESALELGPGWGNYTLNLAAFCKEVACVDISQDNS